ncbi:hypothetical protein WB401_30835 [Streptomyces brasiliscabiei]|uniref:Uncharacterized protein n=1 Tax=Streptomyces brasiliscabiei TaxID=2736302 RepID=A0ABU8G6Q5_9ACTN
MADHDLVLVTGDASHVTTIAQVGSELASATDKQHSMTVTDRRKD